jgi:hypothetical protein
MADNQREDEKHIDEAWKASVENERQKNQENTSPSADSESASSASPQDSPEEQDAVPPEINFLNYITSLIYQTMVFLGEIPNPLNNRQEKNLNQAKLLIDTLAMLREKTTGNLTQQENEILEASLYELQMKYVSSREV